VVALCIALEVHGLTSLARRLGDAFRLHRLRSVKCKPIDEGPSYSMYVHSLHTYLYSTAQLHTDW